MIHKSEVNDSKNIRTIDGDMNIKIKDMHSKSKWIEKLGVFLHDSEIHRERRWDKTQKKFEINVTRMYYEGAQRKRFLWCIPIWQYYTISAKLVIAPVKDIIDKRRKECDTGEPELLLFLKLLSEHILEIESDFGTTHLVLEPEASLEAIDIGIPSQKVHMTDFFRQAIEPKIVEEISKTVAI